MRRRWCSAPRWSSPAVQLLVLSAGTLCALLPLCRRLPFSYFYLRSVYLDAMSEEALQDGFRRGQDALRFWRGVPASPSGFRDVTPRPELLVAVVTARRREGGELHYLLRVMQQLRVLLEDCGPRRCAEVLVCDVEGGPLDNPDAARLEGHFQVIRRTPQEQERDRGRVNTFEREKRDYVFCLRRAWQLAAPRNLLVLEDDALPGRDFFAVVRDLLGRSFAAHTLYVKLYHPERLQRYWNPEPYRLLEWVGLGVVGASALLLALPRWNPCALAFTPCPAHLLLLTLYFMAAAELLGRHYLLEARRLSPQLYAVSPATECCTPAMLFPGNASQRAAAYLEGVACSKGNAKDTALYRLARARPGEHAHSVEPNLVAHIGAYSSVRPNPPRPKLL
ncbi:post-GPI attachment to proteins factor 4-like [Antennarius striatus]|uniref:post-GPI attachment to proteins factor 4-like n=1 Tax=Antennarius striatus TaxID=241820 RepID=UPI0035AF6B54